jgi:hypothetical protein
VSRFVSLKVSLLTERLVAERAAERPDIFVHAHVNDLQFKNV